ncbi:hypothetical protein EG829_10585 [bacterium]|nr:hypothetical protein [bacterium]
MDRKLHDLHRKMIDLHEKSRQEAMSRLEGKELEAALKKIDEIYRPLERLSAGQQARLRLTRKYLFFFLLQLPLVILFFIAAEKSLNPVMYFDETMNMAALFILLPLLTSGAFYLVFMRLLRQKTLQGLEPPVMTYRPLLRYPLLFSASLVLGAGVLYAMYAIAGLSMNYLNKQPVLMTSTLVEINETRALAECRVTIPAVGQVAWGRRNEALIKLPKDRIDLPLKQGDSIVILGRKSPVGVVVDRIQKAR